MIGDEADSFAAQGREILRWLRTSRPVRTSAFGSTTRCNPGPVMVSLYPVSVTPGAVMPKDAAAMVATRLRNELSDLPRCGMHAVGEQDHVGAAGGIDPDGSSGESGVAVGADGKQFAAIARIGRVDIPAEAAQDGLIGGRLRAR